jgi:transposase
VVAPSQMPKDVQRHITELEARLARAEAERQAAEAERDSAASRAAKLQSAYDRLLEHYELLKRRLFVAKAERVDHRQLQLEFEETKLKVEALAAELGHQDEPPEPPKPRNQPKGRRNLRDADIAEERIEILDPELEGKAERIGFEESYLLGYLRGGPRKLLIARAKYKLPNAGRSEIVVTPRPRQLMKKGLLAPSAIAHVLISKYHFGLPFYRQVAQLKAEGIELDDGTMCRYAEHIGASLGPIVDACAKEARQKAFCLSTDATGICIRPEPLPSKQKQACRKGHFFVVLADQEHVFFEYQPKHTSAAVCDMFRGFSGYIQADAHTVYDALFRGEARSSPTAKAPKEVACWSHARRKFWEAATVSKEPSAREALVRLKKVFELERQWDKLPPSKRTKKRQQVLKPILTEFFRWLQACHEECKDVRSLLSTATGYATRHEAALLRFLQDGRLKLTNNHSERALRAIAVGRKNWLFCGSDDHAQSAANLFSLIASCKLHGLDPETYLREIIRIMPLWPSDRYLELAPRYWAGTRARLLPSELEREVGPIDVPAPPASAEEQPSAD